MADPSLSVREAAPDSTLRPRIAAATPTTVDNDALFDWAERQYPEYFPSHQATQVWDPYVYRFYPETHTYLAVTNGSTVQVLGPEFGPDILTVGDKSQYSCQVNPQACTPPAQLDLYSISDSFFGSQTTLASWPYADNASASSITTCLGSGCPTDYEVASFKLVATGGNFTIGNLSAVDLTTGSPVQASFGGISQGTVVASGQTTPFTLRSSFTHYATVNLKYSFTVLETGQTFSYFVQLQTN